MGISAGLVTGGEWPHAGGVTFTVLYSKRDLTVLVLHFRSMVVDISDRAQNTFNQGVHIQLIVASMIAKHSLLHGAPQC